MKNKVGFFGGCFNPPSNIHINIANKLIEDNTLDKVIFVPVGDFYSKEGLIPSIHRYNMLKMAINKYECFEVDDIELKINKKLYAAQVFKLIEEKYKEEDIELYFIMGSDNFDSMYKWKDYKNIKNKYKYIVVNRNTDDINSTQIRNMIKNNDNNVEKILSKEVFEYIKENNLYV